MTKWVKTKIIFTLTVVLVTTIISLVLLDPLYPTNDRVMGVVTQSAQMFPRYRDPYKRVVVELENGNILTFEEPVNFKIKKGNKVKLQKYKRNITGLVTYKLI